jgi:hypothetical protein
MKCEKCGGYVEKQEFFESGLSCQGWKCLNCCKIVMIREKELKHDEFRHFTYHNPIDLSDDKAEE